MIYLLAQGLFEKSDSIAYDLATQYRLLSKAGVPCRIFSEEYRSKSHPGLPIETVNRFESALEEKPAAIVYHWCDGWGPVDDLIKTIDIPVIVRWHNNTPPWFFAPYSLDQVSRTLRGFRSVLRLAGESHIRFMTNSNFSSEQLSVLGIPQEKTNVVYPASRYIVDDVTVPNTSVFLPAQHMQMLFVGRVAPHKGHKHVVCVAKMLEIKFGIESTVTFPGRPDPLMMSYQEQIEELASQLGVDVRFPGEVTDDELATFYRQAHAFVCLSEHEGFGLPAIEAMRMGVPVLGYRSTAVAEILRDHPLGCDSVDYEELARRLYALSMPEIREAVLHFQQKLIVPRFTIDHIRSQLFRALAPYVSGLEAPQIDHGPSKRLPDIKGEIAAKLAAIPSGRSASLPVALPIDPPGHFVTAWDLEAFSALSQGLDSGDALDFRDECIRMEFKSARPIVGPIISMGKKLTLRAHDGVISAIARSHHRLSSQIDRLEKKVDVFASSAVAAAKSGSSISAQEKIYDAEYFEGHKTKSNYDSYSRDAKIPGQVIAQDIYNLFKPRSFLDVGCALGYVVKSLRAQGVEAIGVDVSRWAVDRANVPFIGQLDASSQQIPGMYDVVMAYDVLEHIPESQLGFSIGNLWTATRQVLIVVPAYYEEGTTYDPAEPTHVVFHPRVWWRSVFERCGVALDDDLGKELDETEHARTYGYSGRFIVGRKR